MKTTTRAFAVAGLLAVGTLLAGATPAAQAQGVGVTFGPGGVTIGTGNYAYGQYPYGNAPGVVTYGRGYSGYAPAYVAPGYAAPVYQTAPAYAYPRYYTYPSYTSRAYTPVYRYRRW